MCNFQSTVLYKVYSFSKVVPAVTVNTFKEGKGPSASYKCHNSIRNTVVMILIYTCSCVPKFLLRYLMTLMFLCLLFLL